MYEIFYLFMMPTKKKLSIRRNIHFDKFFIAFSTDVKAQVKQYWILHDLYHKVEKFCLLSHVVIPHINFLCLELRVKNAL